MSELLNIPVVMHGLWHAGSYDPFDFLGRLIGDKPWIRHAENSMIECYSHNWVATTAHRNMINETYDILFDLRWSRTGWPMEYTKDMINSKSWNEKENIIVFPHRIAPEKRLDLFQELAARLELAHYQFCVAMEMNLTKPEYHKLLQRAKFAVSFADQETLGISMYESACAGACPIVPDRLSYTEMYSPMFKRANSIDDAVRAILEYENADITTNIKNLVTELHENFFSSTNLINKLKEYNERS
jgi:hypothetical protein